MNTVSEIIHLKDALLTMPVRPAFGGRDEHGNEVTVNVYLLKLLLQDGRVFIHPYIGDKKQVQALERKIRKKGQVNLENWHKARDYQEY